MIIFKKYINYFIYYIHNLYFCGGNNRINY